MEALRCAGYTDGQAGEIVVVMAGIMERENETWMAHLGGTGPVQQAALSDLRGALLRGLRGALSHRAGVGGEFLEDVVQDSLRRLLERLPQFEGRSRFLTWAMSIAVRVAMSELRHRRWKDVSLDEVTAGGDLAPERAIAPGPGPAAQSEREAILAAMGEVIRTGLTEVEAKAGGTARGIALEDVRPGRNRPAHEQQSQRHLQADRTTLRKRLKQGLESAGFTADDVGTAFAGGEEQTMSLSKEEIAELLRLIGLTRDEEIDCERCLALVAEFAERELAGRSVPAAQEAVAQHLSICSECCDEYASLLQALKAIDG